MAVPGHDERDREFATRFGLRILHTLDEVDGVLTDSGQFSGLPSRVASEPDQPVVRGARHRALHGSVPAARLAYLAPTLLGTSDSDGVLRALRCRAGAGG